MITSSKRSSLKIVFACLSFVLSFFIIGNIPKREETNNQVLGVETQKESQGFPVRLKIPSIQVDADIKEVGLTLKGAMDVPESIIDVGWFSIGPLPGEKGSAVLAGHLNGKDGEAGVFANLDKLKEGDVIYIEDDQGKYQTFAVRESREYKPGYADEVFSQNDGQSHLNLVTCDGVWNTLQRSYTKRLVVFADLY